MNQTNENMGKHMPPLSARMKAVSEMVSQGSRVADIGCDHGYVSIYLYKSGICKSCIAADVKEGPINSARQNIEMYDCADGVEARLSDGLKNIKKGEANCIVISGMGGKLVISILSDDINKIKSISELVLEPQSDADEVRKFICENGSRIEKEVLVEEKGKFYPVIKAVRTDESCKLFPEEYIFGPCLLKNKDAMLWKYLNKEKRRISDVITSLETANTKASAERTEQLKKEAEMIKKAMLRYENIILASGSPRRRELLEQIGINAQIVPSNADESVGLTEPKQIVEELAKRKCESVADNIKDGIIIGADTIVALDGSILGKPTDEKNAEEMLAGLSGKIHQVYTGVCIIKRENSKETDRTVFSCRTDVEFADIAKNEIQEYVASGEPMDKAGAYGIQGIFARYVKRIDGDYYNVVGLPVSSLYAALKKMNAI